MAGNAEASSEALAKAVVLVEAVEDPEGRKALEADLESLRKAG